jgi:putative SOS response-associated peptidase YedK
MCGRFSLRASGADLAEQFGLAEAPDLPPRYNIAPTQPVAVVRAGPGGVALALLRWGLIPRWAKGPEIGSRLINARAEAVAEKPAFREAFRRRRCLVPADGFFEWQARGGRKQPYHFRLRDGRPFAFAGLWESWRGEDGEALESCAILTTEANGVVGPVHGRMPVILGPADYGRWLDPRAQEPGQLRPLLRPYPAEEMAACPVGPWVNDPRHEGPRCLEPLA